MAQGLAGDSPGTTEGTQTLQLMLVELRTLSNLVQGQGGTLEDELTDIRQSIGTDLGISTPPIPISL